MKIVIVGGGKIGEKLCEELSTGQNDVLLIEKNAKILERLMNKYDISGMVGNGADVEVQKEMSVGEADIFISVTEMDEVNIIAAVLAQKLGAKETVARVRNPEYSTHLSFVRKSLGISALINPELSAARDIVRVLRYQSALSVESFFSGRVNLVEAEVTESSSLIGCSMREFRQRHGSVIACIIHRGEEIIIPTGEDVIQQGDRIHVTGNSEDMVKFFKKVGNEEKKIGSALIVGGGKIAYYLLDLLRANAKMRIRVIEQNEERALLLSQRYPRVEVIHADGSDQDVLDEQQIEDFDAFIALTGMDEENLITSVYARHKGVKKVITKMSRRGILQVLTNLSVNTIITPKQIVANEIIRFVRTRENAKGSNIEALYRLADNQVEALLFNVDSKSRVCNIPLQQLAIKPNVLIAYILRGDALVFPNGQDILQAGDRVIVIAKDTSFKDLDDILK